MGGSGCANLLYCKCHKISFKHRGSFIDSPNLIKKKKTTINPQDDNDICFQYAGTIVLNFDETEIDTQRISNIEPIINNYN